MKNFTFLRNKNILFTLFNIACFFPSQIISGFTRAKSRIQDQLGKTNDFIIDINFSVYYNISSFYLINNYTNSSLLAHTHAAISVFTNPFTFFKNLISFDLVPNHGQFNYCIDNSNL